MKHQKFFFIFLILFFFYGCDDLNVNNPNTPSFDQYYVASPENVEDLAGSLMNSWFITAHEYNSLGMALWVASDAGTCSWGTTRDYSFEPRIEYSNSPSNSNAYQNEGCYGGFYRALSDANDVLKLIEVESVWLPENNEAMAMAKAVAYFVQGISLGYLGLVYDKAFIITHHTDITRKVSVSGYNEVIDTALASLDRAIEISSTSTFIIPPEWLPGEAWDNSDFAQLARSYAARLLVYRARNSTESNTTDWQRVYDYSENGIQKDFEPMGDMWKWYSRYHIYSIFAEWGQVDMYVVNMMDPRFPSHWVDAATWNILPQPVMTHTDGIDDRIFTDYQYLTSCPFKAERGYYHFSCYRYKRLDNSIDLWTQPLPEFRKAENDYLLAEAAVHLGKLQEAADIMNASPRVTRGGLPPLAADQQSILKAIHHERMVELMLSGFGVEFFEMRKHDLLQKGTPLHFPIPGSQLKLMQMPYYTFGGTTGVPGVDISNGGW